MGIPVTEFRAFDITGTEPTDRTTEGEIIDDISAFLDLGIANISAGSKSTGVFCFIYRCSDLNGSSKISNMKFGLTGNSALNTAAKIYCDITDTWTQNKTAAQVQAGTPGLLSKNLPASANIEINGSGDIEGVDHADTSQYIYLVITVASNESIGTKGGADGSLKFTVQADYE